MELSNCLKNKLNMIFNLHSSENDTIPAEKILPVLNSAGINIKPEKVPVIEMSFSDLKIFVENLENEDVFSKNNILNAFKYFDENNSGFVELTKLKHLFSKYEIDEIVRLMDIRDGKINYEKFIKMLE